MAKDQYILSKSEKDGKYYLVSSSILISTNENKIKFKLAKSRTPYECYILTQGNKEEMVNELTKRGIKSCLTVEDQDAAVNLSNNDLVEQLLSSNSKGAVKVTDSKKYSNQQPMTTKAALATKKTTLPSESSSDQEEDNEPNKESSSQQPKTTKAALATKKTTLPTHQTEDEEDNQPIVKSRNQKVNIIEY